MPPIRYMLLCLLALLASSLKAQIPTKWLDASQQAIDLHNTGKTNEAIDVAKANLRNAEQEYGNMHNIYAIMLYNLAFLYDVSKKYTEAEVFYLQCLYVKKNIFGEDHPEYAQSLHSLATVYRLTNRNDKAEILYLKAIDIYKKTPDKNHRGYSAALHGLALLYELKWKYAQAEPLYIQAALIRKAALGQQHSNYFNTLSDLADLYNKTGKYAQAEILSIQILKIKKSLQHENRPDYAQTIAQLADAYRGMGNYAQAEPLYRHALMIQQRTLGEKNIQYAHTLNSLASLYNSMGNYSKAEPLFATALEIIRNLLGEKHPSYANVLNNLAGFYHKIGQYNKSAELFLKVLKILKETHGENHPEYAAALNSIAMLSTMIQEYDQAQALYEHAQIIFLNTLGENHPYYATLIYNLASLYEKKKQYNKAEKLYERTLNIRKTLLGERHPDYASSLHNLGQLYAELGKYAQAEDMYAKALAVKKSIFGENNIIYANTLGDLGVLYDITGKRAQAESLFLQAQDIQMAHIENTLSTLSEKEKEGFLKTLRGGFELLHSFALKRQNPVIAARQYDNALVFKGLLLQSSAQLRSRVLASADTALLVRFERWESQKRAWVNALNLSTDEHQQRGIVLETLENDINALEKELSRRSSAFAEGRRRIRWQDVQQALKPHEAAVEIVRFNLFDKKWKDTVRYAALIVTPQAKQPQVVPLTHGKLMEARGTQGYRAAVANRGRGVGVETDEAATMPADSLYTLFWQPVQHVLDSLGGFRTVYLSPDGAYHQINPLALPHPKGGYLADSLDLRIVGSTRDLAQPRKGQKSAQPSALFGFPDYAATPQAESDEQAAYIASHHSYRALERTGNLLPLPGTRAEVENIGNVMRGQGLAHRLWQGAAASEAQVRALRSPRVLHIATHGFFETAESRPDNAQGPSFENPYLRCGLLLAGAQRTLEKQDEAPAATNDGILTAYEAASLRLEGTELVVLSACETGLGVRKNGEGVYGLHRAFQIAGAQTVVYSLWKVADEQTQALMSDFYHRWLAEKKPRRQAFAEAQAALRQKHPEPYFWAAFVLVGE